ncbi:MAG: WYL domain-containing protein [Bacteroidales bacterium]|nr:WYL domain-containing protein [Bacteroidales bacterium]
MPRILYRELRFRVIDRCLRDEQTQHTIASLTEACNRMLSASYGVKVSRRTVQYDISILRNAPYCIVLNKSLLRQGIYRYADTSCVVNYVSADSAESVPRETQCTVMVAVNALHEFEQMLFQMGENVEIVSPAHLRQRMVSRLHSALERYEVQECKMAK